MQDVSGFGFVINVIASNTFPAGFGLSQFADDGDPFDFPAITINDTAMGLNGDLITWSKASPLKTQIAVIAGSDDDANLSALLEANRTGRGKQSARDVITVTAVYPSGNTLSLTEGSITEGMSGTSVSSAGRLKTKVYHFAFENRIGVGV
jgi:hypothetical protein